MPAIIDLYFSVMEIGVDCDVQYDVGLDQALLQILHSLGKLSKLRSAIVTADQIDYAD